jgi:hypothetical protein
MFWAVLVHPQKVLHKWHLVHCLHVTVSQLAAPVLEWNCNTGAANWLNTCTIYQVSLFSTSWEWASNTQHMQRPLILNKVHKIYITLVSLYWVIFLTLSCTVFFQRSAYKTNNFVLYINYNKNFCVFLDVIGYVNWQIGNYWCLKWSQWLYSHKMMCNWYAATTLQ